MTLEREAIRDELEERRDGAAQALVARLDALATPARPDDAPELVARRRGTGAPARS